MQRQCDIAQIINENHGFEKTLNLKDKLVKSEPDKKQKKRFFEVGSAENPGPNARYNIAGNLIRDNAQNNNIAPQNRDQVVIGEAMTIEVQQNINGNEHHDVFPLGSKTKMKNEDEK